MGPLDISSTLASINEFFSKKSIAVPNNAKDGTLFTFLLSSRVQKIKLSKERTLLRHISRKISHNAETNSNTKPSQLSSNKSFKKYGSQKRYLLKHPKLLSCKLGRPRAIPWKMDPLSVCFL